MKVDVKNINGEVVKSIDLPEEIYNVEMNDHVLHLVTKAYMSNRRQGTHATKTRAFVRGGGKKPFRQKGTGNARQGTTRAPHMPGGAISHGPQPRKYKQKVNRKTKLLALKVGLSDKLRHGHLIVVDDFSISEYSTKQVRASLDKLSVNGALLSDERKDDFLYKSARNLKDTSAKTPAEINAEDLLRHESLVISENGLNALHQRF